MKDETGTPPPVRPGVPKEVPTLGAGDTIEAPPEDILCVPNVVPTEGAGAARVKPRDRLIVPKEVPTDGVGDVRETTPGATEEEPKVVTALHEGDVID
jgi:hypothetical protein